MFNAYLCIRGADLNVCGDRFSAALSELSTFPATLGQFTTFLTFARFDSRCSKTNLALPECDHEALPSPSLPLIALLEVFLVRVTHSFINQVQSGLFLQ